MKIAICDSFAKKIINETHLILKYILEKDESEMRNMVNKCLEIDIDMLFDEKFYFKQGYLTPISVLPPNVRPDINHNYMIIQVSCGCKIIKEKGKSCGFCASYDKVDYYEKTIEELESHILKLWTSHKICISNSNCVFLADGDPLASEDILIYIEIIKSMLPQILYFESFISTKTILSFSRQQWNELKKLGLRKVYWGVESADETTLRIIGKPQSLSMIQNAKMILETNKVDYDIIVLSGVGGLLNKNRSLEDVIKNPHVFNTSEFINDSNCSSVFISRLQIPPYSNMSLKIDKGILYPLSDDEMEQQYRSMVKHINKDVRGSYGNQFVIERIEDFEI